MQPCPAQDKTQELCAHLFLTPIAAPGSAGGSPCISLATQDLLFLNGADSCPQGEQQELLAGKQGLDWLCSLEQPRLGWCRCREDLAGIPGKPFPVPTTPTG